MHGCLSHPESIVLTTEDYADWERSAAALTGIIQASLVTKHMLFVGYGLADDNFRRIAKVVSKSIHNFKDTDKIINHDQSYDSELENNILQQELNSKPKRKNKVTINDKVQKHYYNNHSQSSPSTLDKYGTVLELNSKPFSDVLWPDYNWIFMDQICPDDKKTNIAYLSRIKEILLDYISMRTVDKSKFILNP